MTNIVKHMGMIENTGKKCVVVFLQIPGRDDHALVVDVEALPDRIHDPLMNLVTSPESQHAKNLGEVLGKRVMPDTGVTILQELHQTGYLQAQPTKNIVLVPRPGSRINLSEMIAALNEMSSLKNPEESKEVVPAELQSILPTQQAENESPEIVAKNLLVQAEILQQDAAQLIEKAYSLDPSLKPVISTVKEEKPAPKTQKTAAIKK